MKHTAAKAIRALCGMVVMLALAAGITSVPVLAASNGIYVANAILFSITQSYMSTDTEKC